MNQERLRNDRRSAGSNPYSGYDFVILRMPAVGRSLVRDQGGFRRSASLKFLSTSGDPLTFRRSLT
jgi:hypothetical protein